ncbi:MAG: hypothetical protein V4450_07365 [Bacteroidota bacterium]
MFGFNIAFNYAGRNYSADVTCFDDTEPTRYEIRNLDPSIPNFPDPLIMTETNPDQLDWVAPDFKDICNLIAAEL